MSRINDFISKFTAPVIGKRYLGFLPGSLPVSEQNWGQHDFLSANEASLYVNRAVTKRAEKVGEIEFILKNAKGETIDQRNDLLDLLYKPNKVFTGRQFWALTQKYLDLTGEAYIYIERERQLFESSKIVGLHILRPDLMTPKYGDSGEITEYEYRTTEKTITYKPAEVLFLFNPDPKNPLRGQSLLKAGVNAIQTEKQISTYHSRVLQNGGKVEGVFQFKTAPLTKEQLTEMKEQYKKNYAEAKRAGIPLFLGGDATYTKTGLTPDELSYLEAKKMTLEDISILTGVPKAVLGSMDDVQYSNADASIRIFLRETIRPLLRTLTTALDEVLFPDDLTLDFVDPTPENMEEKLKETETGIRNYFMTINEARARHGLEDIEGGDEIYIPFNMMALGASAPGTVAPTGKRLKSTNGHPLAEAEARQVYGQVMIKRMDSREVRFNKRLKDYLEAQRDRIITDLKGEKTFRKQKTLDDLLRLDVEVKLGKEVFTPVLTELLKEAGIDAMELVGSGYDFNVNADIVSWIDNRTTVFLTQINETTFGELRSVFAESLAAGDSRDALVRRIEATYGDITKARAQTIARTEVHNSTQYGTLEGYKQAGLETKIWVAVLDASTRHSHAYADGEERPIGMPFSNGLMMPGDPRGPAEEVINCRCTI